MDRVDRLVQETKGELARIQEKHEKEWNEILLESQGALSRAKTRKELKKVSKVNKEKMEELGKRQQEELVNLQREFTKALLSR